MMVMVYVLENLHHKKEKPKTQSCGADIKTFIETKSENYAHQTFVKRKYSSFM